MMSSSTMLTTAALLCSSRRQASLHRLRPLISSTGETLGGKAVTVMVSSVVPDARVEQAVDQVDGEIGEDDQHAIEHRDSHHQRIVAIEGRLDEVAPDPRNAEDLLDDDRAGDGVD